MGDWALSELEQLEAQHRALIDAYYDLVVRLNAELNAERERADYNASVATENAVEVLALRRQLSLVKGMVDLDPL